MGATLAVGKIFVVEGNGGVLEVVVVMVMEREGRHTTTPPDATDNTDTGAD